MSEPEVLLSRYGSPLFRYDLHEVRASAAALRASLPDYAVVLYSLKANPHPDLARALYEEGCRAEVSSPGELTVALAAGYPAADCLYTGPGKSTGEVCSAIERGVRMFSTESLRDLTRVVDQAQLAGVTLSCLLRVNCSGATADVGMRMSGKRSQFGFALDAARAWAEQALGIAGPHIAGLHFFPASNVRTEEGVAAEFENSVAVAASLRDEYGLAVRWLDLGGGFAAPYAAEGSRVSYPNLADRVDTAVRKAFKLTGPEATTVAFESGRYLVGTAGRLLSTVVDVKQTGDRTFVILDSGINHLGGMSGLRRIMPITVRPERRQTGGGGRAILTGPLCTPADILAPDVELDGVQPGDALMIPNVGAYGLSASLVGFLSRELPVEVVVDGERIVSASRQVLSRVTAEDAPRGESPGLTARRLVPDIAAHAARADADAAFPVESLALLRASGLMGLLVPRRYGGMGADLHRLVEVVMTLARACTSTAMIFGMHCQQVDAVVRYAGQSLRDRLLPRIAAGEVYLASITSEREKGGYLLTSASPLVWRDGGIVLERDAPVVTGGAYADGFLVTMRAAPEAPPSEVSLVYADRAQLDIQTRGTWNPLGMRATESNGLLLRGILPADQIVGAPGRFRQVAVDCFMPVGHIAWSAAWLGTARHALAALVQRLRSPQRPSSIDLSSDLVAERLATARMDVEAVSAYLAGVVDEVADHRARGDALEAPHVQIHLNTLKVMAAELSFRAVDRCLQLAGLGLGYMKDSPLPLERAFRDLRSGALNYSNDRLLRANGFLQLNDRDVKLI